MELLKQDIRNNLNIKGVAILATIIYSVLTIFGMESNGILKSVVIFCTFGIFGSGIYLILAFGILFFVKKYLINSDDHLKIFVIGVLLSFTLDCMLETINVMMNSSVENTFETAMNGGISGGVVAFVVVYISSILISSKGTMIFLFLTFGFFVFTLLKNEKIISFIAKKAKKTPKKEKVVIKEKPKSIMPKIEKTEKTKEIKKPLLLKKIEKKLDKKIDETELKRIGEEVCSTFEAFKIQTKVENIIEGNSIIQVWISKPAGFLISKIRKLEEDVASELAVHGTVRISRIFGTPYLGIDIPKEKRSNVYFSQMANSDKFKEKKFGALDFCIGKNVIGDDIVMDVAKMPHILIAGTTGSGKSVSINSLILSNMIKNTPDEVKFLMIDPKMVELSKYSGSPYLVEPVITEAEEAVKALEKMAEEMDSRYRKMSIAKENELDKYNKKYHEESMPKIIVVVDELADLMELAKDDVESYIARLAQKARGCGIHLVIGTQTPRKDIVTGKIKANIPIKISFMVGSKVESRICLDENGAETLLGKGDGLLKVNSELIRFQGAFADDNEINSIIDQTNKQYKNNFNNNAVAGKKEELKKIMYDMVNKNQCGIDFVKSQYNVGYENAKTILKNMEELGWLKNTSKGYKIKTKEV